MKRSHFGIAMVFVCALGFAAEVAAQCTAAPVPGCLRPTRALASKIRFRNGGTFPRANALNWDWARGPQTPTPLLGSPETGADNYFLCTYDTGALLTQVDIPGSATQWRRTPSATGEILRYRGPLPLALPHGVRSLTIYNKINDAAKVHLVAMRDLVPVPTLPFLMPEAVTLQLVNTAGGCWEADYVAGVDMIYANTASTFKAKGE